MYKTIIKKLYTAYLLLRNSITSFSDDRCVKLGAALAFYTIFSIGPFLVIIISLCGIFFGQDAIEGKIYWQIKDLVGSNAAAQIQEILKNIQHSNQGWFATIVSLITLLFGATGVFTEIQDSINFIWNIKAKPKRTWLQFLTNRVMSFSMILTMGFLMLVSLLANSVLEIFSDQIIRLIPESKIVLLFLLNNAVVVGFICLMFTSIFKFLPDAYIEWKSAFRGGVVTALLFMFGKYLIGLYLGQSKIGTMYGAAGSVLLIMMWVYYSSIILYFGAEFTKICALHLDKQILPKPYAVMIIKNEKEIKIKPENV